MAVWRIVGEPRKFWGNSKTYAWSYVVRKDSKERNITVIVPRAAVAPQDLPGELQAAVKSEGLSVMRPTLTSVAPPRFILVGDSDVRAKKKPCFQGLQESG